ncbi:MAG: zinc ABC transporter substrate-binding protein, partial [Mangrovicoccus sp.]
MRLTALAVTLAAGPALADAPRIVADIAPVHSLVAQVLGDLGDVDLLLEPGVSPHAYSLRPSEARMLGEADMIIRIGPALTPWLDRALARLADGVDLQLAEIPGTRHLEFRENALFPAHDHDHGEEHEHEEHAEDHHDAHGHEDHDEHHDDHEDHADHHDEHEHEEHAEDHHDDHGHEDHDEHHDDHEDHAGHDDHAEHHDEHEHDDHEDHAEHEGEIDPHLWLDPANAQIWLPVIAEQIASLDPDHADQYRANAAAAVAQIDALTAEIDSIVAPLRQYGYYVGHDAYHYFETRFDIYATGAVALSDARMPGPRRIAELQAAVSEAEVRCMFVEPQVPDRMAGRLAQETGITMAVIDPIGIDHQLGADLYGKML